MTEPLVGITSLIVLGVMAQLVAWRFRIPSILLLLIGGFVAGPLTGLLDPDALLGELLFPFVSLAVGIILFEGGLNLRMAELREVGGIVLKLITVGVLVTWALTAVAGYFLLDISVSIALVIGAILVVTGPTVVLPLLRHVRPSGRVGAISKWEGITIDPVGAILAVLVLEAVVLFHEPVAEGARGLGPTDLALHAIEGLLLEIGAGVGVGVLGAAVLIFVMRRRLVPDFLQNPFALMVVAGTLTLANSLQEEAGLVSTTLLGILMANQKWVSVRRIVSFKEDLRVLLLSGLFILLGARLDLSDLSYIDGGAWLFLGALVLVIRPLAVWASSVGSPVSFREQIFLSWMAPRGIVAAAVASVSGFRLAEIFPNEAAMLVPIVFLVIVGTVALYGLTISPLSRRLGLAQPEPQGVLFVGAHAWARRMAHALHHKGVPVLLVDTNEHNVLEARALGMRAQQANVLSEGATEELDLGGIGRLVAMTPNDEVNALAALHFAETFESSEIYQLRGRSHTGPVGGTAIPPHLSGRPLFSKDITFSELNKRTARGAVVESISAQAGWNWDRFRLAYGERALPLMLVRRSGQVIVFTDEARPTLAPGDTLVALVDPKPVAPGEPRPTASAQPAP